MHSTLRRAALGAVLIAAFPVGPVALARQASDPTAAAPATAHRSLAVRFAAADTDHDGHLTLAEAQAAGMRGVVRNFDAIDAAHHGYVTLDDIRAFHHAKHAAAGNAANGSAA